MRLAVLVLVSGCLISPVMKFGEGKSKKQAQRDTMHDFTPARLVVDAKWQGEVTTRKIRVYADDQYRTQNVKWQQTFDGTVELANIVLEPLFGLRLVTEYQKWNRHVPGSTLETDLVALAALDPGTDVFAVVGLTSSLPLVSATFDELGLAQLGGRHLMVRGYADIEERKLYEDAFRDLMPEERELALEQRRQHKTAVVLLHEIGHNLGVDHEEVEDLIMSASYSHRATKLGPRAQDIMLKAIDARLGRGAPPQQDVKPVTRDLAAEMNRELSPVPAGARQVVFLHISASGDIEHGDTKLDDSTLAQVFTDAGANAELVIRRAKKAPKAAVERVVKQATAANITKVSITLY